MSIFLAGMQSLTRFINVNKNNLPPFGVVEMKNGGDVTGVYDWNLFEGTDPDSDYVIYVIDDVSLVSGMDAAKPMYAQFKTAYGEFALKDVAVITGNKFKSAMCDSDDCCDPEGVAVELFADDYAQYYWIDKINLFDSWVEQWFEGYFDPNLLDNLDVRDAVLCWLESTNSWFAVTDKCTPINDTNPVQITIRAIANLLTKDDYTLDNFIQDTDNIDYSLADLVKRSPNKEYIVKGLHNSFSAHSYMELLNR